MDTKKDNALVSLIVNIIIPVLILTKFSGEDRLGPVYGLIAALALPVGYGLYDLLINKRKNIISILGLISVLLTGGIGLLKLPVEYVAIKESAIPLIIGIVVLVSVRTKYPLFNKLIYRQELLNVNKINERIEQNEKESEFNNLLKKANYYFAASFFVSAILNYVLAKTIVVSPAGSEAFNSEIGKMTALSFPVIAVPSTIIIIFTFYYVMKTIRQLTNLTTDEILSVQMNK